MDDPARPAPARPGRRGSPLRAAPPARRTPDVRRTRDPAAPPRRVLAERGGVRPLGDDLRRSSSSAASRRSWNRPLGIGAAALSVRFSRALRSRASWESWPSSPPSSASCCSRGGSRRASGSTACSPSAASPRSSSAATRSGSTPCTACSIAGSTGRRIYGRGRALGRLLRSSRCPPSSGRSVQRSRSEAGRAPTSWCGQSRRRSRSSILRPGRPATRSRRAFSRRAIVHEPMAYAKAVGSDFLRAFAPTKSTSSQTHRAVPAVALPDEVPDPRLSAKLVVVPAAAVSGRRTGRRPWVARLLPAQLPALRLCAWSPPRARGARRTRCSHWPGWRRPVEAPLARLPLRGSRPCWSASAASSSSPSRGAPSCPRVRALLPAAAVLGFSAVLESRRSPARDQAED